MIEEQELWLTDTNGMPYKLTRKLREPEPRQSDTLIHWEEPKVRPQQEMQQQVPNEIRLQTVQHSIPVQVPQRQEQELSPFQKRMLRGDDYRSFSPKSITFLVVHQRDELGNQQRFHPSFPRNNYVPSFFSRPLFLPMYQEVEYDDEGRVVDYRKHFFIPKYAKFHG